MSEPDPEASYRNKLLISLSRMGFKVFVNAAGRVKTQSGQYVTYGLARGSSDIIGLLELEFDDDFDPRVSTCIAVFVAIECKMPRGRLAPEQRSFLDMIDVHSGFAHVAVAPNATPSQEDCDRQAQEILCLLLEKFDS